MNCRQRVALSLLSCLVAGAAHAAAPVGRYTVSMDTVLDLRTQRTWQRAVPAGTFTQAQASAYCAGLTLSGGGWRLPTIMELQSIMDPTRTDPSIDLSAFPSTPADQYWSATNVAGSGTQAWVLHFFYGWTENIATTAAVRVRCVR